MRPTNAGEMDRARVIDETVGRPYDLLRSAGLGDLDSDNMMMYLQQLTKFLVMAFTIRFCNQGCRGVGMQRTASTCINVVASAHCNNSLKYLTL